MNIPVKCEVCNSDFKTVQSRLNIGKGRFCSKKCFDNYKNSVPTIELFWRKVDKTENCWLWKAGLDKDGYGQFHRKNNPIHRAHRFSYFIHKGEIPIGMNVCHACDNPKCVNPDHLFIGTNQENVDDRNKKNRQAKGVTNGAYTHPEKVNRGVNVASSKLKETDIIEIRQMAKTKSQRQIGCIFNVSHNTIGAILRFKQWKHIV